MKKKIAVLLIIIMLAGLLAGCGRKPSGTYVPVDDYYSEFSSLTFKGNKVIVDVWGISVPAGTFKIKGDQMILKLSLYGEEMEETMSFSKKGKSIFLDGEEYVKGKKPASVSAGQAVGAVTGISRAKRAVTTFFILLFVVFPVAAIVVLVLMRKKIPWVDRTVDRVCAWAKKIYNKAADPETRKQIKEGAEKVGRKVSATAGKAAAKVSSGVANGTAAFKGEMDKRRNAKGWKCPNCGTSNALDSRYCVNCGGERQKNAQPRQASRSPEIEEFPEERRSAQAPVQNRRPAQAPESRADAASADSQLPPARRSVDEDHCCVCGKPLDEDAVKLFDHPHGVEARLCKKCHTAMYILASGTDMDQFSSADRYLKHYMATADTVVAKSLDKFISKAEARIYSDMMGE